MFARSESLGLLGIALTAAAALALGVITMRELTALVRLATIEKLHGRAAAVLLSDDRNESRAILRDLLKLAHQNPRLARARHALASHAEDIIDGADMIKLAERELMSPLDHEARRLVSSAAQRVSIVTAISPRAAIDIIFVFVAALRLIRQLARLYGGRPGALGMIRLLRHVIAHLAITGGMAASDSLVQQMLGHGVGRKTLATARRRRAERAAHRPTRARRHRRDAPVAVHGPAAAGADRSRQGFAKETRQRGRVARVSEAIPGAPPAYLQDYFVCSRTKSTIRPIASTDAGPVGFSTMNVCGSPSNFRSVIFPPALV